MFHAGPPLLDTIQPDSAPPCAERIGRRTHMWLLIGLLSPWLGAGPGPAPRVPAEFAGHPRLADAARVLAQSATGRAVIARYLATDYVLVAGRSSERATNTRSTLARISGHPPDFLTDHLARQVILFNDTLSPAAVAVGLTHEIIHVLGGAPPGTRALGDEELRAWNVALDFYLGLPDSLRASAAPKYGAYARWRKERPEEFALTMRCQYPDTPGCPVPGPRPTARVENAGTPGPAAESGAQGECELPAAVGPHPRPIAPTPAWWNFLPQMMHADSLAPRFPRRIRGRPPCVPAKSAQAG